MNKLLHLSFFLVLFSTSLWGQSLSTFIFTNFNANGKILQTSIVPELEGQTFILAVVKNNKVAGIGDFVIQSGVNVYDLRRIDGYEGHIDGVVTNLPKEYFSNSKMVQPSFSDELSLLFFKDRLGLTTINFAIPRTFMGYSYSILIVVFIGVCVLLGKFLTKKKIVMMVIAAWIGGAVLFDIISIKTHLHTYREFEKGYLYNAEIKNIELFVAEAKKSIEGHSWIFQGKFANGYHKLLIRYSLSGIPKVPDNQRKNLPSSTFIITSDPPATNQEVIITGKPFSLFKQL